MRFKPGKIALAIAAPVFAAVFSLAVSSASLIATNKSPREAFALMWEYGSGAGSLMEAVNLATSYYIAAIAIALTFRAGLFNIGVEGQLRLGSLFAAYFGAMIVLPPVLHILAIFIISQEEQVTMGQLAQMLDLTPRAITGLMAGLEKKKFVIRTKDKEDARITWLSLSEDGKKFLKFVRPDASKKLSGLFEVLTKKEQIELVRIIEKLTDHMKSQIDE